MKTIELKVRIEVLDDYDCEYPFDTNIRYTSRVINGVTYNSYMRGPVEEIEFRGTEKYKLIITK